MTAPVEQYQADTEALAASTVVSALAFYAALQAGRVSVPEASLVIATAVVTANAVATTLADAYVAAHIEQATGVPTPTVGVPPRDDTDRLMKAVEKILNDTDTEETFNMNVTSTASSATEDTEGDVEQVDQAAMRIERLAHSEPLAAAQSSTIEVMAAQPVVVGWRRQMDADPCELCKWWYAGGRIYRTTTAFQSHPGCNCQPEPVTEKEKSA